MFILFYTLPYTNTPIHTHIASKHTHPLTRTRTYTPAHCTPNGHTRKTHRASFGQYAANYTVARVISTQTQLCVYSHTHTQTRSARQRHGNATGTVTCIRRCPVSAPHRTALCTPPCTLHCGGAWAHRHGRRPRRLIGVPSLPLSSPCPHRQSHGGRASPRIMSHARRETNSAGRKCAAGAQTAPQEPRAHARSPRPGNARMCHWRACFPPSRPPAPSASRYLSRRAGSGAVGRAVWRPAAVVWVCGPPARPSAHRQWAPGVRPAAPSVPARLVHLSWHCCHNTTIYKLQPQAPTVAPADRQVGRTHT